MSDDPTLPFDAPDEAEEWRPAVGFEGLYEVSNLGRVWSVPRKYAPQGHMMTPTPNKHGYYIVSLRRDGKRVSGRIHCLVAAAFIGPRPDDLDVLHGDGNPANNNVRNLRYGTPSENGHDMVRHGRSPGANQTHCIWGHPYDEVNTYISCQGKRMCRPCIARRMRERRARLRARAATQAA